MSEGLATAKRTASKSAMFVPYEYLRIEFLHFVIVICANYRCSWHIIIQFHYDEFISSSVFGYIYIRCRWFWNFIFCCSLGFVLDVFCQNFFGINNGVARYEVNLKSKTL